MRAKKPYLSFGSGDLSCSGGRYNQGWLFKHELCVGWWLLSDNANHQTILGKASALLTFWPFKACHEWRYHNFALGSLLRLVGGSDIPEWLSSIFHEIFTIKWYVLLENYQFNLKWIYSMCNWNYRQLPKSLLITQNPLESVVVNVKFHKVLSCLTFSAFQAILPDAYECIYTLPRFFWLFSIVPFLLKNFQYSSIQL